MSNLKKFKIKFFGSKSRKEQIIQLKMEIEAESRDKVEDKLRYLYGYKVINSLKIHEI